jgi:hypothetical protein
MLPRVQLLLIVVGTPAEAAMQVDWPIELLALAPSQHRILLMTHSNDALDQLVERLYQMHVPVVRVGARATLEIASRYANSACHIALVSSTDECAHHHHSCTVQGWKIRLQQGLQDAIARLTDDAVFDKHWPMMQVARSFSAPLSPSAASTMLRELLTAISKLARVFDQRTLSLCAMPDSIVC